MKSKLSRARARISGRYAMACAMILAIGIPTVAIGAGEGRSVVAGKRNPRGGGELTRETQIIAQNGSYGTRQSNKGAGGGAIYGCRTEPAAEPCLRGNNLKTGHAFQFETDGNLGGTINTKDANGVPFATNATGKVANLNADRVDGKEAGDFAATGDLLFAAVADGGSLVAGRGATASSRSSNTSTTVTFNRDVSKCSFAATANGSAPAALAAAAGTTNTQVVVTEPAEDPAVLTAFHLQVIC